MAKEQKKNYEVIEQGKDAVKFKITIAGEIFEQSYEAHLKEHLDEVSIKGFRKGQAPRAIVEPGIQGEVTSHVFEQVGPLYLMQALNEEKITPIAPPEYQKIEKYIKGGDFIFEVSVPIMPEFKLGDLKKIKIKMDKVDVTDPEVDDYLNQMKEKTPTKEKEINEKWAEEIIEYYKIEGLKKNDLAQLKVHIKGLVQEQKEAIVQRKAISELVSEAIKSSKIELPQSAIDFEASERERMFRRDLQQIGTPLEVFCERNGVKFETLQEMWKRDSKEALENDVLLKTYAATRKIELSDDEYKDEVEKIKKSEEGKVKDTGKYEDPSWQEYVRSFLTKQKAYKAMVREVLGDKVNLDAQ